MIRSITLKVPHHQFRLRGYAGDLDSALHDPDEVADSILDLLECSLYDCDFEALLDLAAKRAAQRWPA